MDITPPRELNPRLQIPSQHGRSCRAGLPWGSSSPDTRLRSGAASGNGARSSSPRHPRGLGEEQEQSRGRLVPSGRLNRAPRRRFPPLEEARPPAEPHGTGRSTTAGTQPQTRRLQFNPAAPVKPSGSSLTQRQAAVEETERRGTDENLSSSQEVSALCFLRLLGPEQPALCHPGSLQHGEKKDPECRRA